MNGRSISSANNFPLQIVRHIRKRPRQKHQISSLPLQSQWLPSSPSLVYVFRPQWILCDPPRSAGRRLTLDTQMLRRGLVFDLSIALGMSPQHLPQPRLFFANLELPIRPTIANLKPQVSVPPWVPSSGTIALLPIELHFASLLQSETQPSNIYRITAKKDNHLTRDIGTVSTCPAPTPAMLSTPNSRRTAPLSRVTKFVDGRTTGCGGALL